MSTPLEAAQIAGLQGAASANLGGPHPNRGPVFQATSISLFCLTAIFVALRVYARITIKRQRQLSGGIGADGYFAIAALAMAGGITATLVIGVRFGLGKHIQDQTGFGLENTLKLVYASIILIIVGLNLMRFSILCLYLRMTPVRAHHITIWVLFAISAMHGIGAVIVAIFQCRPVHLYWDPVTFLTSDKPNCVNLIYMNVVNSSFSLVFDMAIWLLPLPVIYKLHAPATKKVGIYVVVAISGLSIACCAVRLHELESFKNSVDITWHLPILPYVSVIEIFVALMTSSVPVIYPLLVKPRLTGRGSKGAGVKSSTQVSEKRWPSQSARGSTAPTPKQHPKWTFGLGKRHGEDTEMNVFGKESMNTFHEIPSTTKLHETSEVPSVKSKEEPEAAWRAV